MKTTTPANDLRTVLGQLGAREFEVVALSMDPNRALAALDYAQAKGIERPVPYAIKLFDSPDWQPSGAKRRLDTNVAVKVTCAMCNGDRFVAVLNDPTIPYGETYKLCSSCNASADAGFWKADGSRFEVAK